MMRSMYSAVSGLKTHQTKMDVIGNNIANVNTVAFKSSSVTFQDILYQTTSGASGANVATGVGGVNAKQIGLGVTTGSTSVNITSSGAAETTGNPFDIRLSDQSTTNFFVVNNGSENLFTRSGSFYVDGAGNLAMTSTGYTVMGWQVDPNTGDIRKDTVSPLRIMQTSNLTSAAEATENGICAGILDKNDTNVTSDLGLVNTMSFYDNLGYPYTASFAIKYTGVDGAYTVELQKIMDADGKVFYDPENVQQGQPQLEDIFGSANRNELLATYSSVQKGYFLDTATGKIHAGNSNQGPELQWNAGTKMFTEVGNANKTHSLKQVYGISDAMVAKVTAGTATATIAQGVLSLRGDTTNYKLNFSTADGTFAGVGTAANQTDSVPLNMSLFGDRFANISIDFTGVKDSNNGGKATAGMQAGGTDGTTGKGKKLGALIGLSVDNNGKVFGTYDNGNTELLGQVAVAQFANAAGLEKVGDNCYTTTLNSGEFDGIGVEVGADGSKMTTGELEMSNVDLSTEFTQMIITQRGFQANSRVITTSDTLLEELVNLKR